MNNRDGRPYEEKTIIVYPGPAKNLDTWMTANGIEGDFAEADTATLNRYFRRDLPRPEGHDPSNVTSTSGAP